MLKYLAFIRFHIRLWFFNVYQSWLDSIASRVFSQSLDGKDYAKETDFVMMVGFARAGKTTYAKKNLHEYFRISTDAIHNFINEISFLDGKQKVGSVNYWERQIASHYVRRLVMKKAFEQRIPVVSDNCNLKRSERKQLLDLAKSRGYATRIIWVDCPQPELTIRLEKTGIQYLELYFNIQFRRFDPPAKNEADDVSIFNSLTGELKQL